jgi:hypothetical protein
MQVKISLFKIRSFYSIRNYRNNDHSPVNKTGRIPIIIKQKLKGKKPVRISYLNLAVFSSPVISPLALI